MRDYGKVHTSFWSSLTTRGMSEDGRMLALYLMTSPHNTIAGVFRLPDGYASEDLQWTSQRVTKGFAELFEKGFANRCETTKWVWVIKHLEWNEPENPNQKKSARKVASTVPDECGWKAEFARVCGGIIDFQFEPKPNGCGTVPKPLPNQKQEQEQKQKQEIHTTVGQEPDGGDVIETIFDYWRKCMSSPKAKLDEKRRGVIRRALKSGYSPRDLCRAIQGCALTPHNQGVNERGQKYLGIHVCLKDADQIDRFMANAKAPPVAPEKKSSGQVPGWWNDDALAKQQAALVGVSGPHPTDTRETFHARIRAAIDNGGKPPAQVAAPAPAAPEPQEERVQLTDEQKAANRAALQAALKGVGVKVTENGISME